MCAGSSSAESNNKDANQYHFGSFISSVQEWCYARLAEDKLLAPNVVQEQVQRPGVQWTCSANACYDELLGQRGFDVLYFPHGATCETPRVLYVHGGSWRFNSPVSVGYRSLGSRLASATGFVVMLLDYPLVPIGNASTILGAVLDALNWLAGHGPNGCTGDARDGPPLFIGGDSSGGGSALSALFKLQEEPGLLVGGARRLAGGFFYSPWTNLACNTPEYYSHAYAEIGTPNKSSNVAYVGDIMFRDRPQLNMESFLATGVEYLGEHSSMEQVRDPVFSPFYATGDLLKFAPPLYFAVGDAESIRGDTLILAQKAAMYNVPTYIDIYHGMWHDFPMYTEGCQNPEGKQLWQAVSALNRTAEFLRAIAADGQPPCPTSVGRPSMVFHYGEAQTNREWFPADLCGHPLRGAEYPWSNQPVPAMQGRDPEPNACPPNVWPLICLAMALGMLCSFLALRWRGTGIVQGSTTMEDATAAREGIELCRRRVSRPEP